MKTLICASLIGALGVLSAGTAAAQEGDRSCNAQEAHRPGATAALIVDTVSDPAEGAWAARRKRDRARADHRRADSPQTGSRLQDSIQPVFVLHTDEIVEVAYH